MWPGTKKKKKKPPSGFGMDFSLTNLQTNKKLLNSKALERKRDNTSKNNCLAMMTDTEEAMSVLCCWALLCHIEAEKLTWQAVNTEQSWIFLVPELMWKSLGWGLYYVCVCTCTFVCGWYMYMEPDMNILSGACVFALCVCVCISTFVHEVPTEASRGHFIPWNWSIDTSVAMWVLGNEPWCFYTGSQLSNPDLVFWDRVSSWLGIHQVSPRVLPVSISVPPCLAFFFSISYGDQT